MLGIVCDVLCVQNVSEDSAFQKIIDIVRCNGL